MTFAFQRLGGSDDPVGPRTGRITTGRGEIRTPAFMPVGTLATVKAVSPDEVRSTGADILLVNAYHLYLRPGHALVERLGGVHQFMDWSGPILSDSGGFQVFSLAGLRKVTEEGVRFRSHIDGSEHFYTPELAMEVQAALGVDIAMPLDHVLPGESQFEAAKEAVERTLRWFERCRSARPELATFAIVQGGIHQDLRVMHARAAAAVDAPGYSIGGLSVGESKDSMWAMTEVVTRELPVEKPRYLMGVGSPEDLVNAVGRGVGWDDAVVHRGPRAWGVQSLHDDSFDLPYRCLLPRRVEGLLMGAGRSLSAADPFLLRTMVQTMMVGQGAGVAAAVAARSGVPPRQAPIADVQAELRRQGVTL